jgi:site-specific recombinase XerD
LGISLAVGQRTLDIPQRNELLSRFLRSRREGLSQRALKFYEGHLRRSPISVDVTSHDIEEFLKSLHCSNGGKHAYFRALRTFYRWLYSPKSGYKLNLQDNPMLLIEASKVEKRMLPSLTTEQVDYLIGQADTLRDKAIISLFADSGVRLTELASIETSNIDWENYTVNNHYL